MRTGRGAVLREGRCGGGLRIFLMFERGLDVRVIIRGSLRGDLLAVLCVVIAEVS